MDFPRVCNINTPMLHATVQAIILVYPNRKKSEKLQIGNYRPASILQTITKY